MARVKRAVNAQKKRRTVLEQASGYRGQRSRLYRKAKEQILHSATYNYRDRKVRKGDFRKLWITRINAAARQNDMTYNRFMQGLKLAGIELDRNLFAMGSEGARQRGDPAFHRGGLGPHRLCRSAEAPCFRPAGTAGKQPENADQGGNDRQRGDELRERNGRERRQGRQG